MPTGRGRAGQASAAQVAFASTPGTFVIDPAAGSDLNPGTAELPWQSWLPYELSIGLAPLNALHRVTILGDLDYVRPPRFGPAGHLQLVGEPTVLYAGTLTAGTLPANPASQTANTLVDSALASASPYDSWTALINANDFVAVQVRITSGPRAGAVGWALVELTASPPTARSSRFSNSGIPLDDPPLVGPGLVDPEEDDPFEVSLLPAINDLLFDQWVSGSPAPRGVKISFWNLKFPYSLAVLPPSTLYTAQFHGCDLSAPVNANCFGCRLDSVEVTPGGTLFARGCALTSYFNVDASATALLAQCVGQYISLIPANGGTITIVGDVGLFDAFGAALWPFSGGRIVATDLVWGDGNVYGWDIAGYDSVHRYSVVPTVTGTTDDILLNGVAKTYGMLPVYDALDSGLVPV